MLFIFLAQRGWATVLPRGNNYSQKAPIGTLPGRFLILTVILSAVIGTSGGLMQLCVVMTVSYALDASCRQPMVYWVCPLVPPSGLAGLTRRIDSLSSN